jgi:uncharacterized protein (TIGR02145 family)
MRKLLLTTAAVAAAIGLAVAGETAFGTFTDTRDGQTYKTVKIGRQTWMAQNLNYETLSGSWCYIDHNKYWHYGDSIFYCNTYGRLYDWYAAKIACPAGYHLPSFEEWDKLVATVGDENVAGTRLKAKSGWDFYDCKEAEIFDDENCYGRDGNGTDDFGFSALPGGLRDDGYDNGLCYDRNPTPFAGVGKYGGWWMDFYGSIFFTTYALTRMVGGAFGPCEGQSVRCIADRP